MSPLSLYVTATDVPPTFRFLEGSIIFGHLTLIFKTPYEAIVRKIVMLAAFTFGTVTIACSPFLAAWFDLED